MDQGVVNINKAEVRWALKRMKSGKAVCPADIPVDVWSCLGEVAVEILTRSFNTISESERMSMGCRRGVLVRILKNKGDVQSCGHNRGMKLMSRLTKDRCEHL